MYLLRAAYAFIAIGLALMVWPKLIQHTEARALKNGDTFALLAGIQVAMLGIRYPVKMLPLLFFAIPGQPSRSSRAQWASWCA